MCDRAMGGSKVVGRGLEREKQKMERGRGGEREVVGWERQVGAENIASAGWLIPFCGWERTEAVLGIHLCPLPPRLTYLPWGPARGH